MEEDERPWVHDYLAMPSEVHLLIFGYLDIRDLPHVRMVCKYFYQLTKENEVWRAFTERRWPASTSCAGRVALRRSTVALHTVNWHKYFMERLAFEQPSLAPLFFPPFLSLSCDLFFIFFCYA